MRNNLLLPQPLPPPANKSEQNSDDNNGCASLMLYRYVRIEDAATTLFQDDDACNYHDSENNNNKKKQSSTSLFSPNQLVWVCKSKGLRRRQQRRSNNKNSNSKKKQSCSMENSNNDRTQPTSIIERQIIVPHAIKNAKDKNEEENEYDHVSSPDIAGITNNNDDYETITDSKEYYHTTMARSEQNHQTLSLVLSDDDEPTRTRIVVPTRTSTPCSSTQRLELFLRARIIGGGDDKVVQGGDSDSNDNEASSSFITFQNINLPNQQLRSITTTTSSSSSSTLLSSTSTRRIRVRYPAGSTYACKPAQLLPVLEHITATILVAAETTDYRRACVVHTLPTEDFMEVGCAFGATMDRIYQTGVDAGHVLPPSIIGIPPGDNNVDGDDGDDTTHTVASKDETAASDTNRQQQRRQGRRMIVGVDKSKESISIAAKRYPHLQFCECDILAAAAGGTKPLDEWPAVLQKLQPSVIAVDINGNRELPAVLQCLQILLQVYQPRLIICKSRALHAILD